MNIDVRRPTPSELLLVFETDPTDAIVPLSTVWFRHDRVDQMRPLRISLMCYLLAKPFIGNSFTLSGLSIPAHLASRLHQDFDAHEFFVGPVTNVPEGILPEFKYEALDVWDQDEPNLPSSGPAFLFCTRNELGYALGAVPRDEAPLLRVATNVDLFTAFTEHPMLLSIVLIYLCAYDALGVRWLRMRQPGPASEWLNRIDLLLNAVGGGVNYESLR